MSRFRTFERTLSVGGHPYAPGAWAELTDEQRAHIESTGVVLEPEPTATDASYGEAPHGEPTDLSVRVAALTSKEDALTLAAELGLTLTETKLGKMRAEILSLAAKPAEG